MTEGLLEFRALSITTVNSGKPVMSIIRIRIRFGVRTGYIVAVGLDTDSISDFFRMFLDSCTRRRKSSIRYIRADSGRLMIGPYRVATL